jgi:hypothetical protein
MLDDAAIIKRYEADMAAAEGPMSYQYKQAQEDHLFFSGDTMYYTGTVEDKGSKREVIFNKVKPYIEVVVGTMIQMRRKPDYQARLMDNAAMQQYSEYMNCLSDWARKTANMDQIETMQDREMLITGYGAVDTNISYEMNPDGEAVAECLRFDDVMFDPLAKEANLMDGRFVRRRKPFSRKEAMERFSDTPVDEFEAYTGMTTNSQYYPDGGEYDKIQPGGVTELDLVQVNYYQWWELQKYWRAHNPAFSIEDPMQREAFLADLKLIQDVRYNNSDKDEQEDLFTYDGTSDYLCMTPAQKADVTRLCDEYGIDLDAIEQKRKCYYTALITDKKVMRKFKSPAQDGFTIKFKTANYDPVTRLWYGMVRSLKKPAEYANKALTEMLYIIASTSKAGVMYEEDAVDDPRRFEEQYATTKAAIRVNAGALGAGKIQPKAQPAVQTGYENILTYADSSMSEVSGISKEFMGTATNKQVAALLESQRINQVLATLATYFDAISLYQLEHARMMVVFIRMLAENSQGRLVRIIGQDGAPRYEQLSKDRLVDEYDIDISESPTTPAQKEQTTQIMIDLATNLQQLGTNIWTSVIPYLPIKPSDQQKLLKAMTPPPEVQQAQAQDAAKQKAMEEALNASMIQATQAKAGLDSATAKVREADVKARLADTFKSMQDGQQTLIENQLLIKNPDVAFKGTVSA